MLNPSQLFCPTLSSAFDSMLVLGNFYGIPVQGFHGLSLLLAVAELNLPHDLQELADSVCYRLCRPFVLVLPFWTCGADGRASAAGDGSDAGKADKEKGACWRSKCTFAEDTRADIVMMSTPISAEGGGLGVWVQFLVAVLSIVSIVDCRLLTA